MTPRPEGPDALRAEAPWDGCSASAAGCQAPELRSNGGIGTGSMGGRRAYFLWQSLQSVGALVSAFLAFSALWHFWQLAW